MATDPTVIPTARDIAYAAGFLDADGCLRIERLKQNTRNGHRIYYRAHISAGQVAIAPLQFLADRWGGSLTAEPRPTKQPNQRPVFRWSIAGRGAEALAVMIEPHMLVKADQVANLIAFCRLTEPGRSRPERLAEVHAIRSDELNRRGA